MTLDVRVWAFLMGAILGGIVVWDARVRRSFPLPVIAVVTGVVFGTVLVWTALDSWKVITDPKELGAFPDEQTQAGGHGG